MSGSRSRDGDGRRTGRRPLSGDDLSLWLRIAASVNPLRRAKPRVPEVEVPGADPNGARRVMPGVPAPSPAPSIPTAPAGTSGQQPAAPAKGGRAAKAPPGPHRAGGPPLRPARAPVALAPVTRPPSPAAPPVAPVERRHARRIASGTVEIEARLDLHGLTQSAAHDRLLGFLRRASADGLKTVLVITGKGGARPLTTTWDRGGDEIGVLRRSVPRWLAEPAFRALVVGFQTAAQRHGGDGAFYVVLRRARGSPSAR